MLLWTGGGFGGKLTDDWFLRLKVKNLCALGEEGGVLVAVDEFLVFAYVFPVFDGVSLRASGKVFRHLPMVQMKVVGFSICRPCMCQPGRVEVEEKKDVAPQNWRIKPSWEAVFCIMPLRA